MTSGPPPPTMSVTHQRPKPSALWWVAGGLLVALGALIGIGLVINVFLTMFQTDAEVYADGRERAVTLDAHEDYLLWGYVFDRGPACQIVDKVSGRTITVHGMGSTSFTKNDREAIGWFNSGSGEVSVTCEPIGQPPDDIDIGPRPHAPDWIGGLVGAIAVPLLFGLAGIATLVLTGIRQAAAGRP